jgi:hypothetical protein
MYLYIIPILYTVFKKRMALCYVPTKTNQFQVTSLVSLNSYYLLHPLKYLHIIGIYNICYFIPNKLSWIKKRLLKTTLGNQYNYQPKCNTFCLGWRYFQISSVELLVRARKWFFLNVLHFVFSYTHTID